MKIYIEIRERMPFLVTENGDIVENVQVIGYHHYGELTKDGAKDRAKVEIKLLEPERDKSGDNACMI